MYDFIEVIFKGERKQIYSNPQQFPFKVGDYVIVEADKGEDLGEVNQVGALLSMKKSEPVKSDTQKTDKEDLNKLERIVKKKNGVYRL